METMQLLFSSLTNQLGPNGTHWRFALQDETHAVSVFRARPPGHNGPKWQNHGALTHAELNQVLETANSSEEACQAIIQHITGTRRIRNRPTRTTTTSGELSADDIANMIRDIVTSTVQSLLHKDTRETVLETAPQPTVESQSNRSIDELASNELGDPPAETRRKSRPTPKGKILRTKQDQLDNWKRRCNTMGVPLPAPGPDGFLDTQTMRQLNGLWLKWLHEQKPGPKGREDAAAALQEAVAAEVHEAVDNP